MTTAGLAWEKVEGASGVKENSWREGCAERNLMLRPAQSNIQTSSDQKRKRKPLTKLVQVWWSGRRKMWKVTWGAELGHMLIATLAVGLTPSQNVFII